MKSSQLLLVLSVLPFTAIADECDTKKDTKILSKCAACHSFNEGGPTLLGPNLFGVVGRDSGAVASFPYSPALIDYEKVWTEAELNKFLEDPMKVIPDTMMAFRGMKNVEDRKAIICLLTTNN
jgi:cytochrome c